MSEGAIAGLVTILFISLFILLAFVFGLVTYFIPGIVAYYRDHPKKELILLINFLVGWTTIGWVFVLVWALIDDLFSDSIETPTSNSTKKEMKEWLDAKDISYDDDMLKDELYELVKKNKE